ncbi:MAG TPA: hypothetical protein VGH51_04730 [Candidatus Angelobacter sp.]
MPLTKEQLLFEIEDLLRTMPSKYTLREGNTENLAWLGRASALIDRWNSTRSPFALVYSLDIRSRDPIRAAEGVNKIIILLNEARHDLRMETLGPLSIAVSHGMTFDYFDEIRKIIEVAKEDLIFVDPYLDAEFVSRYLGHIATGVTIRLLTRYKMQTLLPAVDAFCQQSKSKIEVRSSQKLHDRYVFVDRLACYQSGASFKDGAKSAPTTLTQVTDAFTAMLQTYEAQWAQAKIER